MGISQSRFFPRVFPTADYAVDLLDWTQFRTEKSVRLGEVLDNINMIVLIVL